MVKKFNRNSLFQSKLFEKFINKIYKKGNKNKIIKKILLSWQNLKKIKLKIKIFFFLILEKIRPIFFYYTIKKKKKKKVTITYKPFLLTTTQQYLVAIKWLLIPLYNKKKYVKFNFKLEECFLNFLTTNKINLSLTQKKKTYLIILKNKQYINF